MSSDSNLSIDLCAFQEIRDALVSALTTHEVMTDNPPWSGNEIMAGCVRGAWLDTPGKLRKALKAANTIIKNHGIDA